MVDKKEFRMDLFYRINVFPIHIPKLVDREDDIILLANHFIEKYVSRINECGRQCLFIVPSKSKIDIASLNKDIDAFRFVMD